MMSLVETIKCFKGYMKFDEMCKMPMPSTEQFEIAIKSMEESHKYRWHDLRKDKNDLPKFGDDIEFVINNNDELVYIRLDFNEQNFEIFENYVYWKVYEKSYEVISWRLHKKFEEEE